MSLHTCCNYVLAKSWLHVQWAHSLISFLLSSGYKIPLFSIFLSLIPSAVLYLTPSEKPTYTYILNCTIHNTFPKSLTKTWNTILSTFHFILLLSNLFIQMKVETPFKIFTKNTMAMGLPAQIQHPCPPFPFKTMA